jgi:hypothetical protein
VGNCFDLLREIKELLLMRKGHLIMSIKELKGVFYSVRKPLSYYANEEWIFEASNGDKYTVTNDRPYESNLRLMLGYHENTRGTVVVLPNGIVRVKTCRK